MQQREDRQFWLSPQQKRVYSLHRQSPVYVSLCAVRIEGAVDVGVLRQSLQRLVSRHEILRTKLAFLPDLNLPVQSVAESSELSFTARSLCDFVADQQEAVIEDFYHRERAARFDLINHTAIRFCLFQLSPERSMLICSLSPICADHLTLINLIGEIGRGYEQCLTGVPVDDEPVQYAQFSEWQNELVGTGNSENQILNDEPLTLPYERKFSELPSFEPAQTQSALACDLAAKVDAFVKRHDINLEVLMLACWQVLLSRFTGRKDIHVGVLCDGRVYEEMRQGFGPYAKWPLLHCNLESDYRFLELARRVETALNSLREEQEYFSCDLYGEFDEARNGRVSPPVGFSFNAVPACETHGGLRLSIVKQYCITERFKIRLDCTRAGRSTVIEFHYDPAFISADQIGQISDCFSALLNSVVTNETATISELKILDDHQLERLIERWNATVIESRCELPAHRLFEQRAADHPNEPAVIYQDDRLSYAELNSRANQLSRYMRRLGVNLESRVALCIDRSVEMVVAAMATLKAGGAFVPLDPFQPKTRLAALLADSRASIVLTESKLLHALPGDGLINVSLDADREMIAQEGDDNLDLQISSHNLAYVIYTSGSTGMPKGVMIEHGSVVNLALGLNLAIYNQYSGSLRVSMNAPLSFDSSIKQLIQLLNGHTLVIVPDDARREGDRLISFLESSRVSVIDCTASQLKVAIESGLFEKTTGLPQIALVGGEPIDETLWRLIQDNNFIRHYNVYGPTECTVDSTACRVSRDITSPSIGRPIANTRVHVLDSFMNPVPVGVVGELYIGGRGLARGYNERADATAEKFIPNPLSKQAGERLYKTGDLGRYLPDGHIQILGRSDHQLKIRGFRIEPGEIEAALETHAAVETSVVLAREDSTGDRRLVAYVIKSPTTAVTTQELRLYLQERLPDYLVPTAFVFIDKLPLTRNGKLDREALPPPTQDGNEIVKGEAPRTLIEEVLAGIWSHLLGVAQVGIHDNFFDLGGHSLLAARIISKARKALNVELQLRSLFERPTVAGLSEVIQDLIRSGVSTKGSPITVIPREGILPLSFGQQRLWFLDQLESGSSVYNIAKVFRLSGSLNPAALENTLIEILRRHEVLRTSIRIIDGQPAQIIEPATTFSMPVVDLTSLRESEREDRVQQLAREESRRPFNLAAAPLLRAMLLRLSEREHVVLLTTHHIVFDISSVDILIREVSALYEAFEHGAPSPLCELPVQYADYAHWQRQWISGDVLEASLKYWKEHLAGISTLEFPTDRPRPPVQTYRGAVHSLALSKEVSNDLKLLSKQTGATLFIVLLAAFKSLLYRYTRQNDITIGTPVIDRDSEEVQGLIGFFTNTLVLRTTLSGNDSFRAVIDRVRGVALGAYAHKHLPLELLVEELQPERDLSRTPLFQVMFGMRNAPVEQVELKNLSVSSRAVEGETARFDITFLMDDSREKLTAWVEYNTDLFDSTTIDRMLKHYRALIESVVRNPDQALSEFTILTPEEREQIARWNQTQSDYTRDLCIHNLLEEQVRRTPENVAAACGDVRLTYAELNRRANQLANHLRASGTGPEIMVGVCLQPSLEMLIAVLAVLKAGGAYIPLDPKYPRERLAFMIEDADAPVLITDEKLAELFPDQRARIVRIDADWELIALEDDRDPQTSVKPENLSYVIYTSGSTGRPKGVAIQHSSAVAFLEWARKIFTPEETEGVLFSTSICFDLSVFEMFAPLSRGGAVIVADNALALAELAQADEVTLINTVPSAIAELVRVGAIPDSVITINLAGEPLQNRLVQEIYRQESVKRVYNLYGPSEDTTYSTFALLAKGVEATVPIGRPIENTKAHLLDADFQPVPAGIAGELHLGGDGLARCYLNRPDLTAEKFIPDPFSEAPGARLYRTGDMARYVADGNIEFIGRVDHQVKLRGFRIEIGEIESTLAKHPFIRDAVVQVREDAPGDKRLVAYVVFEAENAQAIGEVRSFLKNKLPDYMIPSHFVRMDQLPLTPNGKVNRAALPPPGREQTVAQDKLIAPRNPIEEVLSGIWNHLLGLEAAGIHDSFFELGGHSLLATRLVSRVREVFDVRLPLRSLFESPTIAELASVIAKAKQAGDTSGLLAIERISRDSHLPLSFAQRRVWLFDQIENAGSAYNIPVAMRLAGRLNAEALRQSFEEIVGRHEVLRTVFYSNDGLPVQNILPFEQAVFDPRMPRLSFVDISELSEAEQHSETDRLIVQEASRPFNLSTGPLLRHTLVRLCETDHVILLTIHHIISDGWSMGVLMRELEALYKSFCAGQPSALPDLSIQYADFAHWQQQWMRGKVLEAQLDYWKRQLAEAPRAVNLRTDRPRPSVQTFAGATCEIKLPRYLVDSLKVLSQQQGATLFMTLLAAFKTLLYRYTWQEDLVVGTPVANRTRVEVEGLIGFFVNSLALRTDVSGNPTFTELLARVRRVALEAYAHQDVPFEKLVDALEAERDLRRHPLFQLFFVLHNNPMPLVELPELALRKLPTENGQAKFDLELAFAETRDGMLGTATYNSDLFDQSTIAALLDRFHSLLSEIVARPDCRLLDYSLMTDQAPGLGSQFDNSDQFVFEM